MIRRKPAVLVITPRGDGETFYIAWKTRPDGPYSPFDLLYSATQEAATSAARRDLNRLGWWI
jgi:hypothetical protein